MILSLSKRLTFITLLAVAGGIALSAWWMARLDWATAARQFENVNVAYLAGVIALVIPALVVRFLRWHFFLRNSGFMVRASDSLRIFFAALVMIVTPGYVGEIIKSYWLRRTYGIAIRSSAPLIFFERFFDLVAVAILFLASQYVDSPKALAGLLALIVLVGIFWRFFAPLCIRLVAFLGKLRLFIFLGLPKETEVLPDIVQLRRPYFFVVSLILSLISWAPVACALKLVMMAFGYSLPLADSVRIFSLGTILGGLSLVPAGIGVTGSAFISALHASGLPLSAAIMGGATLRILTLWFAFGLGAVVYLKTMSRALRAAPEQQPLHFDDMGAAYDLQIPRHMRDLLLVRKTKSMLNILHQSMERGKPLMGLDVGCGWGWYAERMNGSGCRVIGVDLSREQARHALGRNVPVAVSNAVSLPFPDASFDFAYSINVLHHLPSRELQEQALQEIARVLKPGGLFFLQEINVRNPLFRFYIGYIFPLINHIDEGTEFWIRPRELARAEQWFVPRSIEYFTFLPDCMPRALLPLGLAMERILERTPLQVWSAHYMAAMRKR